MNITTPNTSPFDRAVREASARSAALLRSNCTLREQSLIAFAPLVLIDIAFTYAGNCRNYAAKNECSTSSLYAARLMPALLDGRKP